MSTPTCAAVEELVIAKTLGDSHREHVATCATCKGLIAMTGQIETELAEVPVQLGQVPQWIAAMHVGNARRRKRILWGGAFAAMAATAVIAVFAVGGTVAVSKKPVIYQGAASAPLPVQLPPAPPTQTIAPAVSPMFSIETGTGIPSKPGWIETSQVFVSYCTTSGDVTCVGVSSYRSSKEEAKTEASDAALDALMTVVADKIPSRVFEDQVRPMYEPKRRAMIQAFAAKADKAKDEKVSVTDPDYLALAGARRRAATALLVTGSAAVPPIPDDWYWEEYANDKGKGTSFLAYVRYTINDGQLAKLVEIYGAEAPGKPGQMAVPFPLQVFAAAK